MTNLSDAFIEPTRQHRDAVLASTWGHLMPAPLVEHSGYIIFAQAAYGHQLVVIDADFEGVSDSPWYYTGLHDFVEKKLSRDKEGKVFRFDGTCRVLKNGRFRFQGKVTVVRIKKRRMQ